MGKISSGPGGHNHYHINLKSGQYPVDYRKGYPGGLTEHATTTGLSGVLLALESGAHSHRVYLDTPLHQLMSPSAQCIALREDAPGQPPVIPVDFFNAPEPLTRRIRFRIADESGSLSLLTSDGIRLSWHGEGEYRAPRINFGLGNQTLVMEKAPDGLSGGFANSTSRIYLPGGRIMTLARLQRTLNQSPYPMLLVR